MPGALAAGAAILQLTRVTGDAHNSRSVWGSSVMSQPLSKTDILYLQRSCAACGLYNGPLNGIWNSHTAQAEDAIVHESKAIRSQLGVFDTRSENCIATLLPPAQKIARRFLAAAKGFPLAVRIISGTRTYAEQDALFAIGRTTQMNRSPVTKARGGQSNHNFGIAWDVGIFGADGAYFTGKNRAEQKAYADLSAVVKAAVPGLEWGGDWATFPDAPHYQLATGKSASAVRALFEAGKPLSA